ncbi:MULTISPECIES: hypothetical protein [unclassified Streptomyces]|uniref:hypothetical protein n=1 Tax=unclassified Streptomyces TaxID=2593676 RepID=UPI00036B68E5|nr:MULTISPECIES: hypothetical protein [unclassified Streptomyces]AWN29168.1 hypothetical protein DKG71_26250 [Streptomyces sp. NEAU-S7GS2]MYT11874.1 hypothetical protein [Streptomyces sp. SID4951]MYX06980.1 hypothetical protein [Streptomyces sp. SID8375]SCK12697.1 hypothetical protein YWIDRAFT_01096 [Streptomyces sp. SceaMP-e96]
MPSHARPKPSRVPRTLLRAGLVISAAGAALAAGGAATASAAPAAADRGTDTGAAASGLTGALLHSAAGGLGPVKNLQLDPLANTSVDPLANAVSTQIADFKPVGTELLTGTLSNGAALKDLPLVGTVTRVLPG